MFKKFSTKTSNTAHWKLYSHKGCHLITHWYGAVFVRSLKDKTVTENQDPYTDTCHQHSRHWLWASKQQRSKPVSPVRVQREKKQKDTGKTHQTSVWLDTSRCMALEPNLSPRRTQPPLTPKLSQEILGWVLLIMILLRVGGRAATIQDTKQNNWKWYGIKNWKSKPKTKQKQTN